MKVKELREGLDHLTKLLYSWQAKSAGSDLERLALLLERHDDLSVAEFCSAVEKSLRQPGAAAGVDLQNTQGVRESLLQELRQAEGSQDLFEQVVAKIAKMRNAELFAFAKAYSGGEGSFRKKADAIKAIREKRAADASVQRQLKSVSGIF